jgi:hypothetical protein
VGCAKCYFAESCTAEQLLDLFRNVAIVSEEKPKVFSYRFSTFFDAPKVVDLRLHGQSK